MINRTAQFICPKLKQSVGLELGIFTANRDDIITEIGRCSGAKMCGVEQERPGEIHFEWSLCPVIHPNSPSLLSVEHRII